MLQQNLDDHAHRRPGDQEMEQGRFYVRQRFTPGQRGTDSLRVSDIEMGSVRRDDRPPAGPGLSSFDTTTTTIRNANSRTSGGVVISYFTLR
ncbi:hypothetical protein EVAR_88370_1 [Eumeta japonica]|uniref:Uncharacterized protein n=1 Tax=Eumeta variegata TaxID=151549 RepID=A0A4C1XBQ9_EUMVA|nr:hypothetical protein EVAR_88370_1 [Eumeta japonica]